VFSVDMVAQTFLVGAQFQAELNRQKPIAFGSLDIRVVGTFF
jgi:hypothetical protein